MGKEFNKKRISQNNIRHSERSEESRRNTMKNGWYEAATKILRYVQDDFWDSR